MLTPSEIAILLEAREVAEATLKRTQNHIRNLEQSMVETNKAGKGLFANIIKTCHESICERIRKQGAHFDGL